MKRFLTLLLVASILTCVTFSLVSCGEKIPSGSYINESGTAAFTFEGYRFKYSGPEDRYGISNEGFRIVNYKGTYKVNGGEIELKRDGSDSSVIDDFYLGDDYVIIAGTKYTRSDTKP